MFTITNFNLLIVCSLLSILNINAFGVSKSSSYRSALSLNTRKNDVEFEAITDRRKMLSKSFAAILGAGAVIVNRPDEVSASYSAYAAREKDWSDRKSSNDIQVSSARDLKAQLQEIAPMNSEASMKFCPNGPSSAVSPLMENKCGDRMATPSVFGRTEDVAGNSIPGMNGRYPSGVPGGTGALSANPAIGGFPKY